MGEGRRVGDGLASRCLAASGRRATRRKSEDSKVLLAALAVVSVALAACGGSDEQQRATRRARRRRRRSSRARSTSGSWIRARRRSRAWSRATGRTSRPQHPGTKVNIEFVPWAQAHDKFTTSIAGGKMPDVAEMGTTWTPEFADEGAFEQVAKIAERQVRLEPDRRGDARRQGLGQALVRRLARADLSQGHAGEGRRGAAQDVGRADRRVQGDQGQGPGRLPDRLHRADRAHVPADDLAGGRADRHAGRRDRGSRR